MVFNGTTWDRWTGAVTGNVASAAADSGNPVKVGGKLNTTLPTFTDGQRGDLQISAAGRLLTATGTTATSADAFTSATLVFAQGRDSSAGATLLPAAAPFLYNGSTWDRTPGTTAGAYHIIRDAAGNARGANVDASNKLTVSDVTSQGSLATIATNSALPLPTQAVTVAIGGVGMIDTNAKSKLLDPCEYTQHVWTRIDVAAAASTVLVAGTSSKKTYICSIGLMAAGTTNLGIVEGSGTTCGTSPLGLIGGNTAAKGLNLTAQAGASFGNGQYAIAASTVNANDVCLINSAAIQVSGFIVTATP